MNEEANMLLNYLMEIAQKSNQGEIDWTQPNPSTFQWSDNRSNNHFIVTIQKALTPKVRFNNSNELVESSQFLFQVLDRSTKQTVVSISSKERPDFYSALQHIYKGAERGMDIRASKVLKMLLKGS